MRCARFEISNLKFEISNSPAGGLWVFCSGEAEELSTYGHKYGNQNSSGQEPGEAFAAYGKPAVFDPLPQIATNSEKSVATNYTNSTKLFRVIREIRGKPFWRVTSSTGPRLKHWLSKLILGCRIYEPMYLGFAQE